MKGHGGKRPGAGRPKGAKNKKTVALEAAAQAVARMPGPVAQSAASLGGEYMAVDLLRAIYRNEEAPEDLRLMAALKVAQYETAKPTANKGNGAASVVFKFG